MFKAYAGMNVVSISGATGQLFYFCYTRLIWVPYWNDHRWFLLSSRSIFSTKQPVTKLEAPKTFTSDIIFIALCLERRIGLCEGSKHTKTKNIIILWACSVMANVLEYIAVILPTSSEDPFVLSRAIKCRIQLFKQVEHLSDRRTRERNNCFPFAEAIGIQFLEMCIFVALLKPLPGVFRRIQHITSTLNGL